MKSWDFPSPGGEGSPLRQKEKDDPKSQNIAAQLCRRWARPGQRWLRRRRSKAALQKDLELQAEVLDQLQWVMGGPCWCPGFGPPVFANGQWCTAWDRRAHLCGTNPPSSLGPSWQCLPELQLIQAQEDPRRLWESKATRSAPSRSLIHLKILKW